MRVFDSLDAALKEHPNSYIVREMMSDCMICEKFDDLRCGVCFQCSGQVDGEKIKGGHRLWDSKNPENTWYVGNP